MIAITGIGIVSPLGIGKDNSLNSLKNSVSGIMPSENFRSAISKIKHFGEVRGFNPKEYIPAMKVRRMSRYSQFALISAIEAIRDSGLQVNEENCYNFGIIVGTGLASTDSTDSFYEGLLRDGHEGTKPMLFPETVQNIAASHIAIHFGIKGPNTTFSHSDISGDLALSYASELLEDHLIDYAIVSAADELSVSAVTGYSSLNILSDKMMPFDRRRNGFVLSEGGATVILERYEDARNRGADIYCLLETTAFSSYPANNIRYDTTGSSMIESIKKALSSSSIKIPSFVSSSANSTEQLDRIEAEAITTALNSSSVPVTALRSYYGFFHGDSILRIALSALCLKDGIIPKILGLQYLLDNIKLDLVTKSPMRFNVTSVLVNSFSTGGSAACTVIKKDNEA